MHPRSIARFSDWDTMRSEFTWAIPERFNIAHACCDHWAALDSNRVALIDISETERVVWTYGRLKEASDRLAGALAARGVIRGDRIGLLLPQGAPVNLGHFAAYKLGAIALPLFTLFGPDALVYRLKDAGTKVVLTDDENLPKVQGLSDQLPELSLVATTGTGPATKFSHLLEHAPIDAPVDTNADDPACMIYTSGTTGNPKGVLHAHRFLLGHLPSVEAHHAGFPQTGDCGWTPADWAWIGGLMDLAMPCLYHGVPLIARRFAKFDPQAAWDLIAREKITTLFLPPTALKRMAQLTPPEDHVIRTISSGGEALGADLLAWGQNTLAAPINEIYGQTECNLVLSSVAGAMPIKPGSMGRAVPGFDVTIRNPTTLQECPYGEEGEICIRLPSPVAFLRYWNKPEQTAQKTRDGWLWTGDLGVQDETGTFTFVSRDDDMITSAGYRIGPTEIETCLTAHSDVLMAAVVGLPDPKRTEAVTAIVVPIRQRPGLELDLIDWVKSRLSPHMAPRRVILQGNLPMTATGKIQRRKLREMFS